jgi:8-oxo-dGTP diphosphatase
MHQFVIIGTLIYVLSEDEKSVLMVHRHKRQTDDQLGYYNGLGGKMEDGETIVESMQRELMEEANVEAIDFKLKGFVHWIGFGKKRENWLGAVFLVKKFKGQLLSENAEGSLEFIPLDQLHTLNLFDGDAAFLPKVFDESQELFHAYLEYEGANFIKGRCTVGQKTEYFRQ